jgi:hypothetical protein
MQTQNIARSMDNRTRDTIENADKGQSAENIEHALNVGSDEKTKVVSVKGNKAGMYDQGKGQAYVNVANRHQSGYRSSDYGINTTGGIVSQTQYNQTYNSGTSALLQNNTNNYMSVPEGDRDYMIGFIAKQVGKYLIKKQAKKKVAKQTTKQIVRKEGHLQNNPLKDTKYTKKVKDQRSKKDLHDFPDEVDNFAKNGTQTKINGGDGKVRTKVELKGSYRNKDGKFEWIIEPDNTVNHRLFRPKK